VAACGSLCRAPGDPQCAFDCAHCAGEHQQELREAGCSNNEISVWCAGISSVANVSAAFGWANLAWGWKDGGKDQTTNQKIVELDIDENPASIRAARAAGHLTVCYFSVGTLEPFRPDCQANRTAWQAVAVGEMTHWDEEWLDITKLQAIQRLMLPRFQRAAAQGCDAVEPDNIDCYDNSACWKKIRPKITEAEAKAHQLTFNRWQTGAAHSLGLAIAMKNAVGIIPQLHGCYDFTINEQCQKYKECEDVAKYFSKRGKAALQVEYTEGKPGQWCAGAAKYHLETKFCDGSNSKGLCKSGNWTNCFAPQRRLPPTTWRSGTTACSVDTAVPAGHAHTRSS
jgi:hypothetical protein